jgi:hypothetical protein
VIVIGIGVFVSTFNVAQHGACAGFLAGTWLSLAWLGLTWFDMVMRDELDRIEGHPMTEMKFVSFSLDIVVHGVDKWSDEANSY